MVRARAAAARALYYKIRYIFIFSQNLENPVHSKPSL
jgi:hypothetical protein